nr:hypothetical protein [Tanacetum cinerariifolium]
MIPNPDNAEEETVKPLSKMTEGNKKQYIAYVRVVNYFLQSIENDIYIYNLVDAFKKAKDIWEQIKRLMFSPDVTSHVRHSRLMDEFDKFAAKEGESLEYVYERLTTLVNIMDCNNVRPIPVSINAKFLNCLQPEWSKYVTMVHHNQTGDAVSYDVLMAELTYKPRMHVMVEMSADGNAETRPSYDAKAVSEVNASPKADKNTIERILKEKDKIQYETLENAEEIRLKMRNKTVQLNYGKLNALYETFIPQ